MVLVLSAGIVATLLNLILPHEPKPVTDMGADEGVERVDQSTPAGPSDDPEKRSLDGSDKKGTV
jgi:hypothetical protein